MNQMFYAAILAAAACSLILAHEDLEQSGAVSRYRRQYGPAPSYGQSYTNQPGGFGGPPQGFGPPTQPGFGPPTQPGFGPPTQPGFGGPAPGPFQGSPPNAYNAPQQPYGQGQPPGNQFQFGPQQPGFGNNGPQGPPQNGGSYGNNNGPSFGNQGAFPQGGPNNFWNNPQQFPGLPMRDSPPPMNQGPQPPAPFNPNANGIPNGYVSASSQSPWGFGRDDAAGQGQYGQSPSNAPFNNMGPKPFGQFGPQQGPPGQGVGPNGAPVMLDFFHQAAHPQGLSGPIRITLPAGLRQIKRKQIAEE